MDNHKDVISHALGDTMNDKIEEIREKWKHTKHDSDVRTLLCALDNARGINSDAEEHMDWLRGKLDDVEEENARLKARLKELDDSIADGSLVWVD